MDFQCLEEFLEESNFYFRIIGDSVSQMFLRLNVFATELIALGCVIN